MSAQNSRAKILINAFDKQIEVANKALEQNRFKTAEGKISSLQRSLESIKKKDPSYDISHLEQKLNDLKVRCGENKDETLTKRSNDKEKYYANVDANNIMSDYVRSSYLPREDAEALSKIDVSQLDMDKYRISMVGGTETAIERNGDEFQGVIDRHRVKVGNSYPGEAEKAYERFLDQKRYYDYAVKFFPGELVLEKVQKKFQSLFDELGDIENIKKEAVANGVKELGSRKIPEAVTNNPNLKKIITQAFNDESKNTKWDRTILKVNILDKDWTVIRKELTGVLIGRKRFAAIAFKDNKTGKCLMYRSYHIYQQYNGSGYNSFSTGTSNMTSVEVLCKNINN